MRDRGRTCGSCLIGLRLTMALLALSLPGCAIETHQDVMVEMIAVQEEIAELLEAVTTVEQAREAALTIERLVVKWKLIQVRAKKKGHPSEFEKGSLDVEALAQQLKKIRIQRDLLQKNNQIWPELEMVLQNYDAAMAPPEDGNANEHSDQPGEVTGPAGG